MVASVPANWRQEEALSGATTILQQHPDLIGVIILGTLRNGLTLMNVQAFYQLLATGILIIVTLLVDKLTSDKQG